MALAIWAAVIAWPENDNSRKINYLINGRKWWTSGALDPRCKIMIVMGQSDPDSPDRYRRQSMILVPLPHPGVVIKRMLPVFGYDEILAASDCLSKTMSTGAHRPF